MGIWSRWLPNLAAHQKPLGKFVKQISWLKPQSLIQLGWREAQEAALNVFRRDSDDLTTWETIDQRDEIRMF